MYSWRKNWKVKKYIFRRTLQLPPILPILDFASVFIHSWILTVYNFVPYFFHFVLQNKHFYMFLNSQALLKCIVLGAGCLDSQPGAFLPTAVAASLHQSDHCPTSCPFLFPIQRILLAFRMFFSLWEALWEWACLRPPGSVLGEPSLGQSSGIVSRMFPFYAGNWESRQLGQQGQVLERWLCVCTCGCWKEGQRGIFTRLPISGWNSPWSNCFRPVLPVFQT